MSNIELKPCPFCGSQGAEIYQDYHDQYTAGCSNTGCLLFLENSPFMAFTEEECREAWNKRTGNNR